MMNNPADLLIANAELAAGLLQHMADNEIDSDYFAVVTDSQNCGREVQSEHSVTEVALMAAGIIEQLIAQLEAAQKLNPLSVNVSELEATYIGDIRLHMAAISNWKLRAEKAEAELSAANDRIDELELNQVEQSDANSVLSAALDAANEKHVQITLGSGDVMISHIKWPDAHGISFAQMPDGYAGIGLNVDEQVYGKNSDEISATVVIKSSSIESLKVLRYMVQMAIDGFASEEE
ncbi:hypothetical protein [Yersinia pseudotuberculosis]